MKIAKTIFVTVSILSIVAIAGCSGGTTNGGSGGNGGNGASGDTPSIRQARELCANTPPQGGTDLRYVKSENINGSACTTGCHIFHDMYSYCSTLLDDSLNQGCAHGERMNDYQRDCSH